MFLEPFVIGFQPRDVTQDKSWTDMSTRTKAIYGLLLHYFGSADCRIVCACDLL
jgi:hypothetical protein